MQELFPDQKAALVIHPDDNVAVALSHLKSGDKCSVRLGEQFSIITVLEDVPFGHKIALQTIFRNEAVLKYGEEIGQMNSPVEMGGWIHTHNMYCERGKK